MLPKEDGPQHLTATPIPLRLTSSEPPQRGTADQDVEKTLQDRLPDLQQGQPSLQPAQRKKAKSDSVSPEHFHLLPPSLEVPPECLDLLNYVEDPTLPTSRLEFVTGPAHPILAVVDGIPTYAVIQDLVPQKDLLAEALHEVGLLDPVQVEPTQSSPSSSSTQSSLIQEPEDDTLAVGAASVSSSGCLGNGLA